MTEQKDFKLPEGWRFKLFEYPPLCDGSDAFVEFYFDIIAPNGRRWLWEMPYSRKTFDELGFWFLLEEVFEIFRSKILTKYYSDIQNDI